MNTKLSRLLLLGATIATVALACGCSPQNSSAQTQTAAPPATTTNSVATVPETKAPSAPVAPETVSSATSAPLPSNIPATSQLAQVVRLTQAGVDQSIIMTFVTNSSRTFNLDSDKIIYLTDAGAPADLVTAMMHRDQELQDQFAAAQAAQQAQQTQPAPTTEPPPADTTDTNLAPAPEPPVTVNYFYNTLSPYGSWVYVAGYGNCWRPTVCNYNPGWQPYCDRGQWVYSDCGWYWNSEYAWGATFHYGRWFQNPSLGWCWYPDTVWAPSWVTWRYGNNYCGWAPLPPGTTCQAGVGIVYNGNNISVGFGFGLGASCFTFVPTQYFCSPHPHNYCVPPAQVTQVFNNTTVINNFNVNNHIIFNHGIDVGHIAAGTHTPIHPIPVHDINPGVTHGGYANGNHGQLAYHPSPAPGVNHPGSYGNSSLASPTVNPAPNHYSQPGQNWSSQIAPQQHNIVVATIPQRQMPVVNSPMPTHDAPVQPPAGNFNSIPQPAGSEWQPTWQTGTPRNAAYNYGSRQNYSAPANAAAPQHAAPANGSSGTQSSQGGNHGGNPGWSGH
jgi:hypothetical protein